MDIKEELQKSIAEQKDRVKGDKVSMYNDPAGAFDATLEAMRRAIKREVEKDPAKREYGDKSPEDIAELLNISYVVTWKNPKDPEDALPNEQNEVPRISTIFAGIPFAPNVVDAAFVLESLNN